MGKKDGSGVGGWRGGGTEIVCLLFYNNDVSDVQVPEYREQVARHINKPLRRKKGA